MIHIEMYREDQYESWEDAENAGGVYDFPVHSVDEPEHGAGAFIMDDIITAITTAAIMMDANAVIEYRIKKEN
jgi:hypothetical protein